MEKNESCFLNGDGAVNIAGVGSDESVWLTRMRWRCST